MKKYYTPEVEFEVMEPISVMYVSDIDAELQKQGQVGVNVSELNF